MDPHVPPSTPPGRRVAVLFDLDGTLLDSRLSIRETLNQILKENRLPLFSKADTDALIGHPLRHILAQRTADRDLVERMTHRYRAAYNEVGWVTVQLYPGLLDLLHHLRNQGVRIGVVTSKGQQETETLLLDLGLADLFDGVVGDDDQRPLKPDPAPVRAACQSLGVAPQDTVMVGDTTFDLQAGKAAGAHAIGVLWGMHTADALRQAGADVLVRDSQALGRHVEAFVRSRAGASR